MSLLVEMGMLPLLSAVMSGKKLARTLQWGLTSVEELGNTVRIPSRVLCVISKPLFEIGVIIMK